MWTLSWEAEPLLLSAHRKKCLTIDSRPEVVKGKLAPRVCRNQDGVQAKIQAKSQPSHSFLHPPAQSFRRRRKAYERQAVGQLAAGGDSCTRRGERRPTLPGGVGPAAAHGGDQQQRRVLPPPPANCRQLRAYYNKGNILLRCDEANVRGQSPCLPHCRSRVPF